MSLIMADINNDIIKFLQEKPWSSSPRTIDSVEYKKAMLIFYEQNNISAFKKIFMSNSSSPSKLIFDVESKLQPVICLSPLT